jgi:hypothetical protein
MKQIQSGLARDKINSIEKLIPEIHLKISKLEQAQTEFKNIEENLSILKQEAPLAEEKYLKLMDELTNTNQQASNLYLKLEPNLFLRFIKKIRYIWQTSKPRFLILLILIAMIAADIIFAMNSTLQAFSMEIGFLLIISIFFLSEPKYRNLCGSAFFAFILFIAANFLDSALKWTLISIGIAFVGLGFATQSFTSGETMEKKLDEILENIKKE